MSKSGPQEWKESGQIRMIREAMEKVLNDLGRGGWERGTLFGWEERMGRLSGAALGSGWL